MNGENTIFKYSLDPSRRIIHLINPDVDECPKNGGHSIEFIITTSNEVVDDEWEVRYVVHIYLNCTQNCESDKLSQTIIVPWIPRITVDLFPKK